MRRYGFIKLLLLGTVMSGCLPLDLMAATVHHPKRRPSSVPAAVAPVRPVHRPRVTSINAGSSADTVMVQARHRSHGATVSLGQALISEAVPGTNPMKVLSQTPGVMFQSADGQGLETWSAQLFMHGFQQQEIGMTLDGIPLGEMTYRNYNGLNPVQAISSENVSRMDVSQSAGAEGIAATNNLGGSIQYVSRDPSDRMGGTIRQSFGSYDSYHTFIRLDSGKLNPSGTKFFVSYMRNDNQMWRGYGQQFMQQVNAKIVQPIGSASKVSAFFDWSDLHQYNYQDLSPEIITKLGDKVADYYNGRNSGYAAAYRAAQGHFPASFASLSDPLDAAYYDGAASNSDYLGGLKADLALTDRLRWESTVYGHGNTSATTWATPYYPSPTGAPLSELVKKPGIQRFGFLSQLAYQVRHHHLAGGVWYENNSYFAPMDAYAQPQIVDGVVQGEPIKSLAVSGTPFARIYNQDYSTNTFTAFVQDTYRPVENLELHAGFKSILNTTRVGNGFLNQGYYGAGAKVTSGEGLTTAKAFLPHLSADWRFLPGHELFFDISENVHTYAQSGYNQSNSPLATSQAAFDMTKNSLQPQTAWTYAGGYRYTGHYALVSIYGYRTNFNNRLQQITAGSVINPVSTVKNVGSVTMNGVDAGLTFMPVKGLSLANSISYNHAVYDQDVESGGVTFATKDRQVVNYPRLMYKARLAYDWKNASVYVDGSYTGKRNYSYTGDVKASGYWLANAGARYRLGDLGKYASVLSGVKNVEFSFNVVNLTNTKYIATMGENGNPLDVAHGAFSYQSVLPGAPRMYYGGVQVDF